MLLIILLDKTFVWMVDGQYRNVKVAFIIQARMQSERFPGKVLLPMPLKDGKPIFHRICDYLRESEFSSDIIVATSVNIENNKLAQYCINNGIDLFRGDEYDVLSRFIKIAKRDTYNAIVRLTADNPLLDIELLDKTIKIHLDSNNDYTYTSGLPIGMNFEVIKPLTLLSMEQFVVSGIEKEHVTLILKNSNYKNEIIDFEYGNEISKLRLTVDYPSDFIVVSEVISLLDNDESVIEGIIDIYSRYPWLFRVNLENVQRQQ